jgi:hypothetical protein
MIEFNDLPMVEADSLVMLEIVEIQLADFSREIFEFSAALATLWRASPISSAPAHNSHITMCVDYIIILNIRCLALPLVTHLLVYFLSE